MLAACVCRVDDSNRGIHRDLWGGWMVTGGDLKRLVFRVSVIRLRPRQFKYPTLKHSELYLVQLSKLHPSLPSKLINDLYTQYKVTTITFKSPFVTSISLSYSYRYRLNGAPAYCGNNSVRCAEDETVSEDVAIKFF